ncbi:LOW QUALITY PROTEIN: protein FAM110C [Gymnodraco acuticeps]|uniref:LOW QUALITY PROTEIN: protein FAM110C n=1 Tax=Gymnodraco acuticeps TaxID=8218 RepID=A0A6P8T2Q2_GYMAC|nr:LOW QUALITY PROTEIN: protein FAM110C [Gymnodraco acuticeps]
MEATSDTTKILEKGPEYLRKQMELESETKGGMSAVERLAASKLKYVKSEKVVNSTQAPVISIGSASVSSTGSSKRSSNRGGNRVTGSNSRETACGVQITSSPGQVRRSSSKKRPDSILLYRQKCDLLRGSTLDRKHHITRRLLQSSVRTNVLLPEATDKECEAKGDKENHNTCGNSKGMQLICRNLSIPAEEEWTSRAAQQRKQWVWVKGDRWGSKNSAGLLTVPEVERRSGKGVSRSHSDISSRYSKNFADFDNFFKYCGLGSDIIDSFGKENFSSRSAEIQINIRSFSTSTSDDGFSRNSDGLMEEELHEKISQGTSVIERNARIIKWLYSCKNAIETGQKLRDLD